MVVTVGNVVFNSTCANYSMTGNYTQFLCPYIELFTFPTIDPVKSFFWPVTMMFGMTLLYWRTQNPLLVLIMGIFVLTEMVKYALLPSLVEGFIVVLYALLLALVLYRIMTNKGA